MLDDFRAKNDALFHNKKLLLAVSGGVDSMVMLSLCLQAKYHIEVAHVDHHTRNGQSTRDAAFVESFCQKKKIPFHLGHFHHTKGNFQSTARDFRYAYFQKLVKKHKMDFILTAHHKDDRREGFLLNAFRGATLNRLISPRYHNGEIVRPLLSFEKATIEQYAEKEEIPYVVDVSNQESKYKRNFIRLEVINKLKNEIPQGIKGLDYTLSVLQESQDLLTYLSEQWYKDNVNKEGKIVNIPLSCLSDSRTPVLLNHVLQEYGFTRDTWVKALSAKTGALFQSKDYHMVKTRNQLRIEPKNNRTRKSLLIDKPGNYRFANLSIEISPKKRVTNTDTQESLSISMEDLKWPIEIRYWQAGDTFRPKGMKDGNHKKVKKLLTDLKVDRLEKQRTIIIKDSKKILWVYPYRQSEINSESEQKSLYLYIDTIRK